MFAGTGSFRALKVEGVSAATKASYAPESLRDAETEGERSAMAQLKNKEALACHFSRYLHTLSPFRISHINLRRLAQLRSFWQLLLV